MACISTLRNKEGTIIGFQSNLGKDQNGVARRKFHKTYEEAQTYIRLKTTNKIGPDELYADRHKIIAAMQRAAELGTTISEAIEFYATHGARRSNPTIKELSNLMITEKREAKKSKGYIEDMVVKYSEFLRFIGEDTKASTITAEQIKEYIYVTKADVASNTKLDHIRMLSLLFNYGIKKRCVSFNPTHEITKPKKTKPTPKIVSPADFQTLLGRCLLKRRYDRLAIFLLIGFCGVRKEEACRLKWTHLLLDRRKVHIPEDIAKLGAHRMIPIPPNAMAWFDTIRDDRRKGPLIGSNWVNLLRSAIRYAHIKCPKNAIRHAYCSYALAAGWKIEDVVYLMGHQGTPATLRKNYLELVDEEDAKKWWQIAPPQQ